MVQRRYPLPQEKYDLNLHRGYAAWSDDGTNWHSPVMLEGTFGHYIWRAAAYGDKACLCGRRKVDFEVLREGEPREVQSLMLESDDGLIWRQRAVFQQIDGDETAFRFTNDGSIIGIGRRGRGNARLLQANPPYSQWRRSDPGQYVGGPLLTRWNDRWVVGGRRMQPGSGPRTALHWLVDGRLHQFAELPSGGDNSSPGFLQRSVGEAVVSWYSSHEKDGHGKPITAISMADLTVHP